MANRFNAFPCVHCGAPTTQTTTTHMAKSGVDMRRSRRCIKCEQGFVTYEVTAADYAILQAIRKWSREPQRQQALSGDEVVVRVPLQE